MKTQIAFVLIFLMAAQTLVSCGSDTPAAADTTTAPVETTEAAPEYTLPDRKNYESRPFTVLAAGKRGEFYDAEMTGDVVDDTVHARKIAVEEYLGIEIIFDERDSSSPAANEFTSAITEAVMANDSTYDLMTGAMTVIPSLAMEGLFVNVMDMAIDFDNPWWIDSLCETAAINGKLFALTGDLSVSLYKNAGIVYFNKTLQDEFKLGDFYSSVRNGSWTLDTMLEASKDITADLNSDGSLEIADDRMAITAHFTPFATIQAAMQAELFTLDGDELVYQGATDRLIALYERFRTLFDEGTLLVRNTSTYTEMYKPFMEDRNLFHIGTLSSTSAFREMKSDFGILPIPKFDDNQTVYTSPVSMSTVLWTVPVTASDLTLTAEFCELFAYHGMDSIVPAYYEVTLQEKFSRDEETKEMLEIIRDGIRLTPDGYLDRCFDPRPFSVLATLLENEIEPASYIAANESAWQTQLEAIAQAYAD